LNLLFEKYQSHLQLRPGLVVMTFCNLNHTVLTFAFSTKAIVSSSAFVSFQCVDGDIIIRQLTAPSSLLVSSTSGLYTTMHAGTSNISSPVSMSMLLGPGVAMAVAGAVVGALYIWRNQRRSQSARSEPEPESDPKERKHRRTWSFSSSGMLRGAFPEQATVPEAIMNVAVYYDRHNCPNKENVVEHLVKPMLEYERLSTIPDPVSASSRPPARAINPTDLIRLLVVSEDDDNNQALNNAIMNHLHDSFMDRQDSDLPWWEILIIENKGKGQSAIVLRMHHCLADGYSMVNLFEKIITYEDGTPLVSRMSKPTPTSNTPPKPKSKPNYSLCSFLREAIHSLTLSASRYDDAIAFSKHNRTSPSNGKMKHSGNRSYVMFPSVPLDFVKKLKSAAGVTVNDIIMTAVSQAIHDYCISQDCPALLASNTTNNSKSKSKSSIQCRALMPVALPRPQAELNDKSLALRNTWTMVSADMGVGYDDIMERLEFIHVKMNEIKSTPRAFVQLWIQNTLPPFLPLSVAQQTVYDVFSRHSLVLTNVPGPDRRCLIAGKVGTGVQMFLSNLLPQISFLSYAGQIMGNMVMDPNEIPESDSIAKFYAKALLQLAERLAVPAPLELVAFGKQA
jgi:diacylglycerol O-acyltransferase